ncbi:putative peptide zinc metalloprotease protein [uncultured Gammaproteobacteria bacterium]
MLPRLRDDLTLLPGPSTTDGAPTWSVHDPVRNRWFRLTRPAFVALSAWISGRPEVVRERVAFETGQPMTAAQLSDLIRFLQVNALLEGQGPAVIAGYVRQEQAARLSWPLWLLHHYLFIRIPLLRPHRLLVALQPWVEPFYSRAWRQLVVALGALGLFLALRQWPQFAHTFTDFLSWEGAAAFAVTLATVKVVHEFAHACTATRYGCRVTTMGIAFMVLVPVLYTDTSDAWRLVSRWQRLEVAAAGIAAELVLAALATLAWSFLPDGPVRGAAFVIATVSWLGSVAINLNPMMRFDGYYLLSDALDLANLQERAFAFGRWWLREALFGFDEPPPEQLGRGLQRFLVVFAAIVWLYRLVLFTGIALLVYHFAFKLLGIGLMMVELGWFIFRPLLGEIRQWRDRRERMRLNGTLIRTLILLTLVVAALLVPWSDRVSLPALSRAAAFAALYPSSPGRLVAVHVAEGQQITAGEPVATLTSPDLEFARDQAVREQARLEAEIRQVAGSPEGRERLGVLYERLTSIRSQAATMTAQAEALIVRAPINGVITELAPSLHPGSWFRPTQRLARVVAQEQAELVALVESTDRYRITPGASAWFLPETPSVPGQPAEVVAVESVNLAQLDQPYLASLYGGPVTVQSDSRSRALVPTAVWYRVSLRFTSATPPPAPARVTRGTVRIKAEAASLIMRMWRMAAMVVIRETGF